MTHKIKVIETGNILPNIHYKKHHLQVSFIPRLNAFRAWLVWDDTNKPHKNKIEGLCPYNMSKTAAEHFIRHLYWYQTNIADALKYHEYVAALREGILGANVMSDNTYECDPEKNTECTKEGCFINGGPCHMTVYEEFKKERTE